MRPAVLSPPDLANAVTSFCTIGAGATTLLLSRWVSPQPTRWSFVYACLLLTGIPTLGWHGWGGSAWHVADVGTNLLLAWAMQLAVLGDFYSAPRRQQVAAVSGLVNAGAVFWMVGEQVTGDPAFALAFGDFGGFYVGELVLILDAWLIVGLLVARRDRIPVAARPLLRAIVAVFFVGMLLATASGDAVVGRVGSLHALWHVVGGFGFVLWWAFNHVRFAGAAARGGET